MAQNEQVRYAGIGFIGLQAILIGLAANIWALCILPSLLAVVLAVHTFRRTDTQVNKPVRAYIAVGVACVAVGALFWFAPEDLSYRMQVARAAFLDAAIILFTCVTAAHARARLRGM